MDTNQYPEIYLAAFDISGIQDYIFATNRLRENAGASILVTDILNVYLIQALKAVEKELPDRKVLTNWIEVNYPLNWTKENGVCAEVIYIGGGNAIVAYENEEIYYLTRKELAKLVLEKCPSLTVTSYISKVESPDFFRERKRLQKGLDEVKNSLIRQTIISEFSISEQDPVFGFPIVENKDGEKFTAVQLEKHEAYKKERNNIYSISNTLLPEGFSYAVEMPDLVQGASNSYIAVVHIDGNGMGDFIHKTMKNMNQDFTGGLTAMKKLSCDISNTYRNVFKKLMKDFVQFQPDSLRVADGKKILPMRLAVLDGDDITFLMRADLAIPFSAAFLQMLLKNTGGEFSACAGIALVHNHFPFRIAYELAESCCANAKSSWYKNKEEKNVCYLDFELSHGATERDLKEIRQDRFGSGNHWEEIMLRPYQISQNPNLENLNSYDRFHQLLCSLLKESGGNNRKWPRNRLKRLYESFLLSETDRKALHLEYDSRGYSVDALTEGNANAIFDALEVMDLYDSDCFDMLLSPNERKSASKAQGKG
ncbi:MAG: hypothetical protein F8N38_03790 [Hungatella sp.]|nr:hypothetical protein [Hungatella sp.]